MSATEIYAKHTIVEHQHGDHYDKHESVAEHTVADHTHGADCGHEAVEHDDHVDFVHGHKHAPHGEHYDEH